MKLPFSRRAAETPEAPGVHVERLWSVRPRSDREAGDAVVSNFLLHAFPAKVFKPSLDWNYSFWLGTISAALFLLLIVSGLPLLFLYVPSVERAYQSVKDIEYVVTYGWWIRAVHRIGAHLMVVAVALHLVRVFLTGRVQERRRPGPAARVELGDRRRDAAAHAVPLVHRLPAAVGPAGVLGRHRRHQHRLVRAARGAAGARVDDRRTRNRAGHTDPLLRAARDHAATRPGRAVRIPHVARAQGRRSRARGPRRDPRGARADADHADEDLHAAGRGARHRADGAGEQPRGAGHRRSTRCPISRGVR